MVSFRELAFFGGWDKHPLAGGTHNWGNASSRFVEWTPSAPITVNLPRAEHTQKGVPYWFVNSGTASVTVIRPSDGATVEVVTPGSAFVFHLGADWVGKGLSTVQFGPITPGLQYYIDITTNTPNFDVLQHIVDGYGYNGTQPALVTVRLRSGAVIGTQDQALRALTSGTTWNGVSWAAGSIWLLVVEFGAWVGGWGGNGGRGGVPGTGAATGFNGQNGGQAIRTTIPMRIRCPGRIWGGGGGGGGGGSSSTVTTVKGGGGGGGGGSNMAPNGALIGSLPGGATAPAGSGQGGGQFLFGSGGLGVGGGGNAGRGGIPGEAGFNGGAATGGAGGGTGGQPGAAISYLAAAGAPVFLEGAGNILGTIISEAS